MAKSKRNRRRHYLKEAMIQNEDTYIGHLSDVGTLVSDENTDQQSTPTMTDNNNCNNGSNNKKSSTLNRSLDKKNCVSKFSLYANLIDNNCEDPYEQVAAIEAGEFKLKLSKSAKKRLRRQNKKKKLNDPIGIRSVQMKNLNLALAKKQTKKDIKKMINKLYNLPL